MRSVPVGRIAAAAGLLGAGAALWLLLPLPSPGDIYAARRWGVGAAYVGVLLGFPLGAAAVPLAVLLLPFPDGGDASGAAAVAATTTFIVGANWAGWGALAAAFVGLVRRRRDRSGSARVATTSLTMRRGQRALQEHDGRSAAINAGTLRHSRSIYARRLS